MSSSNAWFGAVQRTMRIRAETSLMVVRALGTFYWGGAAELACSGVNTPPLIVQGGYLELTGLAGPCPRMGSNCSSGSWISRTYSRVIQ